MSERKLLNVKAEEILYFVANESYFLWYLSLEILSAMLVDKDEFIKMSLTQKTEQLWNYGEFISEKVYYDNNISLFLLDNFLVELFFNRVHKEIVGIEIQENSQILYEYVKNLELDELFQK